MIHRRISLALLAALMAVPLATQPTLAMFWNGDENGYPVFSGTVGKFAGPVGAEVVCRYNANGRLRSVTVRPVTMWGNHDEMTIVGWRYQLREADGRAGRLVYKSHVWKDSASTTVATHDFESHRFYVLEDLPGTSAYFVMPVMLWYEPGSSTLVEGRAPVGYDRYLLKRGTESRWSNGCLFDYSVPYWEG